LAKIPIEGVSFNLNRRIRSRRLGFNLAEEDAPEQCRRRLDHGGAIAGFWSTWFSAHSALFDEKIQGERGSYGGLTGPKKQEQEAAKTAWRSVVGDACGGARAKRGCGCLGKKK